jgi:hypothetical protein
MAMSPRLLRPRATGFNPKSISGLVLWLDVTQTSSLTFNGSNVSQANDLSGNGYHFTQSTGANQPAYVSTGMNGKPAVQFSNSAASLMNSSATIANVVGSPTTSPQFTIFSVIKLPSGTSQLTFGSNSDANGRLLYVVRFGASTFFDVVNAADGRLGVIISQAEAESVALHTLYKSGSTQTSRYNGAEKATKTNATSNYSSTSATIQLGKALGVGQDGIFSEQLWYNRALSVSEISTVEKYLASKFGITI